MHKPIAIPPQSNMLHWIASNGLVADSVWYGKSISCLLSTFLSRNWARELADLASKYSTPWSLQSIERFSLMIETSPAAYFFLEFWLCFHLCFQLGNKRFWRHIMEDETGQWMRFSRSEGFEDLGLLVLSSSWKWFEEEFEAAFYSLFSEIC